MHTLRTSAATLARTARVQLSRQSRRYAHDSHHHAASDAPADEPLGKGFYIAVAMVPTSLALYKLTATNAGEKPWLTRLIDSYSYYQETYAQRNKLHTDMIEQAAFDRSLFLYSTPRRHVDLYFPEAFNTGSPYNVPAGSQADISKVVAYYEKQNYEEQARKLEALKNGTLKAEQQPTPLGGGKTQVNP